MSKEQQEYKKKHGEKVKLLVDILVAHYQDEALCQKATMRIQEELYLINEDWIEKHNQILNKS